MKTFLLRAWERTKKILGVHDLKKEQQKRLFIFLLILAFVVACSMWYPKFVWVLLAIEFVVIFLLVYFAAGFAVFKPLVEASAGLSLLIFLAQSYCALPPLERVSDDALKGLLGFGLLYLSFFFIKSLYIEVKEQRNLFAEVNGGKRPWLMLVLFATCVGGFLGQLIQVIEPIVRNLCIYQR